MPKEFVLTFCQWVIGLLFLYSSFGKLKDMSSFQEAIYGFKILPKPLVKLFSLGLITMEVLVVVLMVTGNAFLKYSFELSGLLLFVFTAAFGSVLIRRISTTCNCFGNSSTKVSWIDVFRNIVFILISFSGLQLSLELSSAASRLNLLEIAVSGAMATAFTLIFTNLGEIVALFHNNKIL